MKLGSFSAFGYHSMLIGIIIRKIIGRFLCRQLARILGLFAYVILVNRRKILRQNLRHIADSDERLVREAFINFALSYADFLAIPSMSNEQMQRIFEPRERSRSNLDEALSLGKGALMVSGHLGNYDLGGGIPACFGYKTSTIGESRGPGERIFKLYTDLRGKSGIQIIRLEDSGVVTKALEVLNRNEILLVVGDRDITKDGIKVNYLGTEVSFPRGPAFFSLRTGAPILPTFFIQSKEKYLGIVEPMIEFKRSGNLKKDIKDLTQLVARELEKKVYEYPTQWYVFDMNWND